MDRKIPHMEEDAVLADDYQGALQAVRHLISQGRKKITFMRPHQESYVAQERERGYRDALKKAGPHVRESHILHVGSTLESGRKEARRLLQSQNMPDAIFCFNDPIAIGVEWELLQNSVSIPDDIALVGFSDVIECEFSRVPISTVRQDAASLGQITAEVLLNKMINPNIIMKPVEHLQETRLIIRESSNCKGIRNSIPLS